MLVILDRDGVINYDSEHYIKSPEEWIPIPGSLEAIVKLKRANCQVYIATNQSGIGRGMYSEAMLRLIHGKMEQQLVAWGVKINGIFYCPHHPDQGCYCRKPSPGLLLAIADDASSDIKQAYCIGDSLRDIQAAQKVAAKPILVLTGNGQKTALDIADTSIPIYPNLLAAVDGLLS